METRDTVESVLPRVVSAVRLDEVHGAILGQEGHQLLVGPEGEKRTAAVNQHHHHRENSSSIEAT